MDTHESDPRVRSQTLYWIDCTICGADADSPAPRFASEAQLWRHLIHPDPSGWIRRDDGRILCPIHRAVADCQTSGHAISRWTRHPLDDGLDWRYCTSSGTAFEQRIRDSE